MPSRTIVTGDDEAIHVWDLRTGARIAGPLLGHEGPVLSLATVDLDGEAIALSGGNDETVRAWRIAE